MRTNVYVDGFNLYYGCLKGTPYRWLNIAKLCHLMLPGHDIQHIKYYTARISPRPFDSDQPIRQQAYLRALMTLPNISIIYGRFVSHDVMMPSATKPVRYVRVTKTEEKGSDVNLATHLLHDAYLNDYDVAVVITNDSDLLEPIKIVGSDLGKRVGILNPQKRPSRDLQANAKFFKQIRVGVLAVSQFPPTLTDSNGTFHKPSSW